MIDLRIAQFRLRYDLIQWVVSEVVIAGEKSKNPGTERETDHGYHGKLSHALQDVLDRLQGREEAESVEALLQATHAHARALVAATAEIDRQLMVMRHGAVV